MPLYSTFLPVCSTLTPPRVIVPSWVPRAVHSWTTRSSRMYRRRPSKMRSGETEKMPRTAEPICSRPTVTSPVAWVSNAEASLCLALGLRIGLGLRSEVLRIPPRRSLDTAGGFLLGAATGLFLAWAVGVVALQLPGQTSLRREVQRSFVLKQLNSLLPPSSLLQALARLDPFPALGGPVAQVPPPNPQVLRLPGVRSAAPSVVRILGTACGLGIEGSGWIAAPRTVVTAAHVVAGEDDTSVNPFGSSAKLTAHVIGFDPTNDIVVLRVPGLSGRPLPLVDARPGAAVAVLGYPEDRPFDATPARIGTTTFTLLTDAYGRGPVDRKVTTLRGTLRHGDSGGPAVDGNGAGETTVFAARTGGGGGFGGASPGVRAGLANP